MEIGGIKHLDITLDETNLKDEAPGVVLLLRPSWAKDSVRVLVFNDGISSNLVGCRHSDDTEQNDVIIVKISEKGQGFDAREDSELQIMVSLHLAGYSPPVYATFNNGIIYGFVPGETLNIQTVREDKMIRLIAAEIVKLHSKSERMRSISERSDEPFVFARMRKWLASICEWSDLTEAHERKTFGIPDGSVLQNEVALLKKEIGRIDSPVVFCHNDLYAGNIVYNQKTAEELYLAGCPLLCAETHRFIDFEHAAWSWQAYEIAHHFYEYIGVSEEPDFSLYPDKTYQLKWLRVFLEEQNKEQNKSPSCITDEEINQLYLNVNKLSLVVGMTEALWGFYKALSPNQSIDFVRYASSRLEEYFRRKKEILQQSEIPQK